MSSPPTEPSSGDNRLPLLGDAVQVLPKEQLSAARQVRYEKLTKRSVNAILEVRRHLETAEQTIKIMSGITEEDVDTANGGDALMQNEITNTDDMSLTSLRDQWKADKDFRNLATPDVNNKPHKGGALDLNHWFPTSITIAPRAEKVVAIADFSSVKTRGDGFSRRANVEKINYTDVRISTSTWKSHLVTGICEMMLFEDPNEDNVSLLDAVGFIVYRAFCNTKQAGENLELEDAKTILLRTGVLAARLYCEHLLSRPNSDLPAAIRDELSVAFDRRTPASIAIYMTKKQIIHGQIWLGTRSTNGPIILPLQYFDNDTDKLHCIYEGELVPIPDSDMPFRLTKSCIAPPNWATKAEFKDHPDEWEKYTILHSLVRALLYEVPVGSQPGMWEALLIDGLRKYTKPGGTEEDRRKPFQFQARDAQNLPYTVRLSAYFTTILTALENTSLLLGSWEDEYDAREALVEGTESYARLRDGTLLGDLKAVVAGAGTIFDAHCKRQHELRGIEEGVIEVEWSCKDYACYHTEDGAMGRGLFHACWSCYTLVHCDGWKKFSLYKTRHPYRCETCYDDLTRSHTESLGKLFWHKIAESEGFRVISDEEMHRLNSDLTQDDDLLGDISTGMPSRQYSLTREQPLGQLRRGWDCFARWHPKLIDGVWVYENHGTNGGEMNPNALARMSSLLNISKDIHSVAYAHFILVGQGFGVLARHYLSQNLTIPNHLVSLQNTLTSAMTELAIIEKNHRLALQRRPAITHTPNESDAENYLIGIVLAQECVAKVVPLDESGLGSSKHFVQRFPEYERFHSEGPTFIDKKKAAWTTVEKERSAPNKSLRETLSQSPMSDDELETTKSVVSRWGSILTAEYDYDFEHIDGFPVPFDGINMRDLQDAWGPGEAITGKVLYRAVWIRQQRMEKKCNFLHSDLPEVAALSDVKATWCYLMWNLVKHGFKDPLTLQVVRFFKSYHGHSGGLGHFRYGEPMNFGFITPEPTSIDDFDEKKCNVMLRHWSTERLHFTNAIGEQRFDEATGDELKTFLRACVQYVQRRSGSISDRQVGKQLHADCKLVLDDEGFNFFEGHYLRLHKLHNYYA